MGRKLAPSEKEVAPMTKSEFKYMNFPNIANAVAVAHVPPVQPSARKEFVDHVSEEVIKGNFMPDPNTGEALYLPTSQSMEDFFSMWIGKRPHGLVPEPEIDECDDVWTSGNLGKQGQRWQKLRRHLGSDAATNSAMMEEAKLYSTTFGSTKPGVKPGEKSADDAKEPSGGRPNNPWGPAWRGTEVERHAKIASILKQGTAFALSMAKSAGRKSITDIPKR
jgi:hypothetical protein